MGVTDYRHSVLVLDGDLPDSTVIARALEGNRPLVAADGAARGLHHLGFLPDVVIGDLDSIGSVRGQIEKRGTWVIEVSEQETTDFEKSLQWLLAHGAESAILLGVAGGMVDHTLNNFSVIAKYARSLSLTIVDDRSVGYVVPDRLELNTRRGDRVSLIPLPRARLRTSGLVWELDDEELALGARDGASNRAAGSSVRVQVIEGLAIVFHYSS